MRNILFVLSLLSPFTLLSQTIDWNDFDEERMNEVMFIEMNGYVKMIHAGDSLIISSVVQSEIMPRNYALIKKNRLLPLDSLHLSHNMEWQIPGRGNDLHDTLRAKIIQENACPNLLKSKWMPDFKCYGLFCYTEILECASYERYGEGQTYQDIAIQFIQGWNDSPPHRGWMEADYHNKVIVGVCTFYDKET